MACSRVAKQEQTSGLAREDRVVEKGVIMGSCDQPLGLHILSPGHDAPVWGGGKTEEQEAGVDGQTGGDDEGGEGVPVGCQGEG